MKEKMTEFMKPVCQMSIKEVDTNLHLFQFFHPRDMELVLKKGPGTFDGHTLVLGLLQQGNTPKFVPLNHIPFRVQVHDVFIGCMSITAGKQHGNFVGECMEYNEKNNSNFLDSYVHI
jgi:hypothetical protein